MGIGSLSFVNFVRILRFCLYSVAVSLVISFQRTHYFGNTLMNRIKRKLYSKTNGYLSC